MAKIEEQIKELILSEVKGDLTISNLHSVDLRRSLVEPYLETLEDSFNEGQMLQMYVILKEQSESNEGYQIVYDPKENMFGLNIQGKGPYRVFLGYDGTFFDSLKGM